MLSYTLVEMGSNWVQKQGQTKNHLRSHEGAGSDGPVSYRTGHAPRHGTGLSDGL